MGRSNTVFGPYPTLNPELYIPLPPILLHKIREEEEERESKVVRGRGEAQVIVRTV